MSTFIFSYRCKEAWTLLKRNPNAFILLWVVAQRARREDDPISELEIGEAYLGDYGEYGMSKQNYRTAKKLLEKLKFLTLKITSNGTTAKLINTSIFDNNMNIPNTSTNTQLTPGQHLPNTCLTPNNKIISKEDNKEVKKEDLKDKDSCSEPENTLPSEPVFITLTLNDKSEYPIMESVIKEMTELYPAVDIKQAFRNMKGWCLTNPTKRKTKKGIQKFYNSWLGREQNKNGTSNYIKPISDLNRERRNGETSGTYRKNYSEYAADGLKKQDTPHRTGDEDDDEPELEN